MSQQPAQRGAVRRTVFLAVLALGAIGLSVFVLSRSDIAQDEVEAVWDRSNIWLLLVSQLVMASGIIFMAFRWRALLPGGEKIRIPATTGIVASGLMLNYALPGPVGELAAATLLGRRFGLPVERCLAAGIHARFVGLATAGFLAGCTWLFADLPVPLEYTNMVAGAAAAICLGAVGLWVLSTRPVLLRTLSRSTVGRLGAESGPRRIFSKLDEIIERVAESLGQVGRLGWRNWARAVFWSFAAHVGVSTGRPCPRVPNHRHGA